MLVIGAKGFAKEILEVLFQNNAVEELCFYDDISKDIEEKLYGEYPILNSTSQVKKHFLSIEKNFVIGIGNPKLRFLMYEKFTKIGGVLKGTISNSAQISSYGVEIDSGVNIMHGAIVSNDVKIGKGCIIYYNTVLTHDVQLGDFVEVSPSVTLLGRCKINSFCQIGANTTVLPDIVIGENVIIAAGSVVTKDVPSNCMIAGVPAVIKKQLAPLTF
ncbi:acetyltransferase [Hanstruepera marina]|uniref:acetyltransferase n=1 Tax=Hanstruepera marina TaxID=2873265 RepID=UPI001CA6281A|nr:acetyltransferase [Hanstruepera marina]